MSLQAATAMRDLADCLREEGDADLPNKGLLQAMARAHDKAADRIEKRWKEANERATAPGNVHFDPKGRPPGGGR